MSELPKNVHVIFNMTPEAREFVELLLGEDKPQFPMFDSYEQRREQRFEAAVMHVVSCAITGVNVNILFPDREYAQRVMSEASRRLQEFVGEDG